MAGMMSHLGSARDQLEQDALQAKAPGGMEAPPELGGAAPPAPTDQPPMEAGLDPLIAGMAERAGIDPTMIMEAQRSPEASSLPLQEIITQLSAQATTDSEIEAVEMLSDQWGLLGERLGEGAYGQEPGPNAATGGKPGLPVGPPPPGAEEPMFQPSSPTGNIDRRY